MAVEAIGTRDWIWRNFRIPSHFSMLKASVGNNWALCYENLFLDVLLMGWLLKSFVTCSICYVLQELKLNRQTYGYLKLNFDSSIGFLIVWPFN